MDLGAATSLFHGVEQRLGDLSPDDPPLAEHIGGAAHAARWGSCPSYSAARNSLPSLPCDLVALKSKLAAASG